MAKNKQKPIDKIKEHASNILKKGVVFSKNSIALLRPLSKEEGFRLSKIKLYLQPKDFKLVQNYIKQGRATLDIKRLGLSFMVANSDLQPRIKSGLEIIDRINEVIAKRFEESLEKEFSQRSWQIIQEYVGSNVLGLRNIKRILTLLLLSEDVRVNIINVSDEDKRTLINTFKQLGRELNVDFNSKRKDFDFVFEAETFDNNRFVEMAERIIAGKKYKPNKNDLKFIKKYVNRAKEIKPILGAELVGKVKTFVVKLKEGEKRLPYTVKEGTVEGVMALLKASAQIELREEIGAKDLERVFDIINPNNK